MKLSEFKNHLGTLNTLNFMQANGQPVPAHFHITEMGLITKHFMDCGSTIHREQTASLQIWVAQDTEHRLKPSGLLKITEISKDLLGDEDLDVELEYQTDTVGRYDVGFDGESFLLLPKHTDCLAKDKCGIPVEKQTTGVPFAELTGGGCCTPGSGCC